MPPDHLPETDYRLISQEYAQGAIKTGILVNGGAAVAILSQFAEMAKVMAPVTIGFSMLLFVLGILAGIFTWTAGFMSARYVDRANRGQDADHTKSNMWMHRGLAGIGASCAFFLLACMLLVGGLLC